MGADFTIGQGDTAPILEDQLTYTNGQPANLEGATIELILRNGTQNSPLTLTGHLAISEAAKGKISFTFSAQDTAAAGMLMGSWEVAWGSGQKMRFPTVGYFTVEITPNLVYEPRTIIGLPEVLDRLQVPAGDRVHDAKLTEWITAIAPLIEEHTGPILPQTYDEWYEGGHSTISLRHKPSYGYGTSPLLKLVAVSEYRGPIEYNLAIVSTPTQGTVYSVMVQPELGLIVRRTAGGGTYNFWHDPSHPQQSVHVVYQAGQEQVPANVRMAAIETLKWWWLSTQPTGRGRMTQAQDEPVRPMVALPYHVEAMLKPTGRHPSLA